MQKLEWLLFDQVVNDEFIQLCEEGKNIEGFENELRKIRDMSKDHQYLELESFYKKILKTEVCSDYMYSEPTTFKEICAEMKGFPEYGKGKISEKEIYDRIYGAWLGRCAGCLLGKPVEGMTGYQIETLLKWKEDFPMSFYIAKKGGLPPDFKMDSEQIKRYTAGVFENVNQMLRDDDIDYTLIALCVLEKYGLYFTSFDVGITWLQLMPILATYTAERVAYRNLANGLKPPETAQFFNPYREWIGAQIRADMWGYVNPGNPQKAARYAFRDGIVSHQKNGVYGEIFIACTIANCFYADKISDAVEQGLCAIPSNSRLAEALNDVVEWCSIDNNWKVTLDRIINKHGHYNWFHTIPNASIVLMALLYGNGDFELSITIAVMAGLDTDCNGATVGSIVGTYLGAERLPSKWIEPLNDRVSTALVGIPDAKISDLAKRTVEQIEQLHPQKK